MALALILGRRRSLSVCNLCGQQVITRNLTRHWHYAHRRDWLQRQRALFGFPRELADKERGA